MAVDVPEALKGFDLPSSSVGDDGRSMVLPFVLIWRIG